MADDHIDKRLETLVGREIVVDIQSYYVYVGCLKEYDQHYFVLDEADVHDLRDTPTTRDMYVYETKKYGVRATRKQVTLCRDQVISFSSLDDVMDM